MYALNTFLRLTRFLANSFIGLVVGFVLGVLFGGGQWAQDTATYISSFVK